MKEGEPELGGLQVPHRDVDAPTPTPGPQPDPFATLNPRPLQSDPSLPQVPVSPAPQPPISQTPAPQAPSQPPAQPTSSASAPVITASSPVMGPTPAPRQFPTQPISSGVGDILLSPAPAKKSKKWPVIVASILIPIILISGVSILIINITNGPAQEFTEDQYSEFYNYATNLSQIEDFINDSINGEVSAYDLFIKDNLYSNNEVLSDTIRSSADIWNSHSYDISYLLRQAPYDLLGIEAYLDIIANNNYPSDIKQKAQEIQNDFDQYSEILNSLIATLTNIKAAFTEFNIDKLNEIAENNNLNQDTIDFLSLYNDEYQSILLSWDQCVLSMAEADCSENIEIVQIQELIDDIRIPQEIVGTIISEDDLILINTVNTKIADIIPVVEEENNEE